MRTTSHGNWFASACSLPQNSASASPPWTGSTTTDLVLVVDGAIAARGYTDSERLAAGELVYTGLVRSFVMAVADRALPVIGRRWSMNTSRTWRMCIAFSAVPR